MQFFVLFGVSVCLFCLIHIICALSAPRMVLFTSPLNDIFCLLLSFPSFFFKSYLFLLWLLLTGWEIIFMYLWAYSKSLTEANEISYLTEIQHILNSFYEWWPVFGTHPFYYMLIFFFTASSSGDVFVVLHVLDSNCRSSQNSRCGILGCFMLTEIGISI